ncbi:MAG: 16S rRNA (cytosine(1402)-N(4))-methyltransferase RsmH [Acidobacteria bacterium]|nr:16S rRNA (cytosine(1402)-N(4))-methyltransferase RsmH [Acidobacteriota bacterium]
MSEEKAGGFRRRPRYPGRNPRRFEEKYKERDPERYPETVEKVKASGKTPAGTHRPIMVEEVLRVLDPRSGETGVDATLGWGGHAEEILKRLVPGGRLLGLDVDPLERPRAEARLRKLGFGDGTLLVRGRNFAGIRKALEEEEFGPVDFVLADLGVSSMQLDDPARGFSSKQEGPLDLRLNPGRGQPASRLVAGASEQKLARLLQENSDEPRAIEIARAVVARRAVKAIETTTDLSAVVSGVLGEAEPGVVKDTLARVFQALRVEVNDEFSALESFLRDVPACLKPGGRLAVLTFHSGEDRRVKKSLQVGLRAGLYREIARRVVMASEEEVRGNPRSAPAKLRWAIRA